MSNDMGPRGLISQPDAMLDPYYTRGKDFPVPDSAQGTESGPKGLVNQSDKQKAPRLNASDGYGPTIKGKEGKAFPGSTNGGESNMSATDEKPTYAGARANVSISRVDGQITPPIKKERI